MTNAIVQHTVDDMWRMAQFISKPGLFGVKNPEQAMALMLVAQAEGRHPATVAMEYDIIQGRPALKAKAKQARFQQSGGVIKWIERTDKVAAAEFSHPSSPSPLVVRWDMERAKTAGLTGKDNWRKFPAQMLSARVISEGVDATFPACGGLMYVSEEVQDFDDKPAKERVKKADVVVAEPEPAGAFSEPVKADSAEFKAMGDGFNRPRTLEAPVEPEAAALDAAINGIGIDPNYEVPTAFKPKRKMVALKDLDREHAERALKLANWQVTKTDAFGPQWKEGTRNVPVLEKLLAAMPKPPAKPTETAPAEVKTAEVVSAPTESYGTRLGNVLKAGGHKTTSLGLKVAADNLGIESAYLRNALAGEVELDAEALGKLEASGLDVTTLRASTNG